MKKLFVNLFFVLGFLLSATAFSTTQTNNKASLSDLEAFVSSYPNVQKLLGDRDGLNKYRELLKSYMGYKSDEFDPVFKKTIEQMHSLVKEVPNFAEQIWKNQASGEAVINIQASSVARSGIETKLTLLEERLAEQRKIYEKEAQDILKLTADEQTKKAQELADTARVQLAKIEARYPDDIKNPSRSKLTSAGKDSELAQARQKLAQERKDFFQNNPQLRALVSFIKYKLMTKESWLDRYRSPFAEDSLQALEDMRKLENIDAELGDLKVDELIKQNINYLPRDELYKKQLEEFEAARDIKKQINKTQDPRLDPEVEAELARVQQENPQLNNAQALLPKLSPKSQKALREHMEKKESSYSQKKQAWQSLQGAYQIEVVDLREQEKFSLREQNSKDIALRPVRALHAAFTGHHTRECVGGAGCESLTPRRWALSALNGVRTYMAEKGGTFDGALRLIRVESPVGSGKYYDDVDAMLKSIDASSEIQSQVTGQIAKYPMFDSILDHLKPSEGSLGFIAGDGSAISQNTGLAAVYKKSPSVIAAPKIKKETIRPEDHQVEKAINKIFNDKDFGYNPGGMVYEAMANDGENVYLLKPRKDRKKYTKEQLEEMLFDEVIYDIKHRNRKIDISKNPAWSLAVENDIKLNEYSYYLNLQSPEIVVAYIKKAESVHDLTTLASAAPRALENHPEAIIEFIKKANDEGLMYLAEGLPKVLENDSAVMEFIKKSRGGASLVYLARNASKALENYPEATVEFIRKAEASALISLASHASKALEKALKNHPEAEAELSSALLRAIKKSNNMHELGAIAENLPKALENNPEAVMEFVKKTNNALKDLAQYAPKALRNNPKALIAALKKITSDKTRDYYNGTVKVFNKLLKTHNEDQLKELFLSTDEGKEVLGLLAKNGNFPLVNEWLEKTKNSLTNKTLGPISEGPHQKAGKESLIFPTESLTIRDCILFLQQGFLKNAQ